MFFFKFIVEHSSYYSKSVPRCVCSYNHNFLIINNGTFLRLNLITIIHTSKRTRLHQSFQNFLGEHIYALELPSISVADTTIFLYESIHFLFGILSKYEPKCFYKYIYKNVLYKNMLFFGGIFQDTI